jgi:hypothetical protein
MSGSILVAGALVVLVVGAAFFTYYEVYPGPEVLTVGVGGMSFGPTSVPRVLGGAFEFYGDGSNLLHISLSTAGESDVYLLNATQAMHYLVSNATTLGSFGTTSHDTLASISLAPPNYPSSFVYSSLSSKEHSAYVTVQKQSFYYLVVLSLSDATNLSISTGMVYGYAALA